jgi:hypothetical protein
VDLMKKAAEGGSETARKILDKWSGEKEKEKTVVVPLKKGKGAAPKVQ